ncbi:MAG TPA: hypothetical protein VL588_01415, partial [Bdellovibrionota bacterium]|nr:hypothetical protein [Bdellovibrionota bacterium]
DLPQEASEILAAAGGDIRDRLLASGVTSLNQLGQDLSGSIAISQANLATFRKFYKGSIGKAVKSLEAAAVAAGEPLRGPARLRPNRQALARICALTLVSDSDWPKSVPWEICGQAVLESVYPDPDGKLTLEVGKMATEIEGQPLQQRVCAYHRVMRAQRLAEILQHPPVFDWNHGRERTTEGQQTPVQPTQWQVPWTLDLMKH